MPAEPCPGCGKLTNIDLAGARYHVGDHSPACGESEHVPMTEREAVARLADMVGELAQSCWELVGTTDARRIAQDCHVIAVEMGA